MIDHIHRPVRCLRDFKQKFSPAVLLLLFLLDPWLHSSTPRPGRSQALRKVIVKFDPDDPPVLKSDRFEGQVRMQAAVVPNGTVSKVEIKGGNSVLAQFAFHPVIRWKYAPAPAQRAAPR